MTISEITRQGFYYARTCKSLWLFGFVAGMASGGSSGGAGGGGAGGGWSVGIGPVAFSVDEIAPIVPVIILAILAVIIMRCVSETADAHTYTWIPQSCGKSGASANLVKSRRVSGFGSRGATHSFRSVTGLLSPARSRAVGTGAHPRGSLLIRPRGAEAADSSTEARNGRR